MIHEGHDAKTSTVVLPSILDDLRHDVARRLEEIAKYKMSSAGLLEVANGQDHPDVQALLDYDLTELPPVPPDPSDSSYVKLLELHAKWKMHNQRNATERFNKQLKYMDSVYDAVATSAEKTAPMFFEELKDACAYANTMPGVPQLKDHYDGARAWQMYLAKLNEERTDEDREYYQQF